MHRILMASAIAVAAAFSFAPAAQADGVTIHLGDGRPNYHGPRHYAPPPPRVVHRHHRHHRDCYTKKVVTHYHGRRIVKKSRICD